MPGKDVELYYKKAFELLQKKEYDKSLQLLDMVIKIDGNEVAKVDLVAAQGVEKASFFWSIIRKIAGWFGINL